jgi:1-aminocyclopropane-1-carboxylate deaminase/D-cysteine desulfhydrase-like pyridoxal-dependent ACC family enzyme
MARIILLFILLFIVVVFAASVVRGVARRLLGVHPTNNKKGRYTAQIQRLARRLAQKATTTQPSSTHTNTTTIPRNAHIHDSRARQESSELATTETITTDVLYSDQTTTVLRGEADSPAIHSFAPFNSPKHDKPSES